jgi:hypothetical protein
MASWEIQIAAEFNEDMQSLQQSEITFFVLSVTSMVSQRYNSGRGNMSSMRWEKLTVAYVDLRLSIPAHFNDKLPALLLHLLPQLLAAGF